MNVRARNPRIETAVAATTGGSWLRWAAATFAVVAIVALLALTLFAGLSHLQPGWRVAQAPSLAVERAVPQDQARRQTGDTRVDDTRVLAR